jgi:hypothetical protein
MDHTVLVRVLQRVGNLDAQSGGGPEEVAALEGVLGGESSPGARVQAGGTQWRCVFRRDLRRRVLFSFRLVPGQLAEFANRHV